MELTDLRADLHASSLDGLRPWYIVMRRHEALVTPRRVRRPAAVIEPRFPRWVVSCLDAQAGVLVNGRRIYEPTTILPGDQVQVGSILITLGGTPESPTLQTVVVRPREPRITVSSAPLAKPVANTPAPWRSGWLVAGLTVALGLLMTIMAGTRPALSHAAVDASSAQALSPMTLYLLDASGSQIDTLPTLLTYLHDTLQSQPAWGEAMVICYGGAEPLISPEATRNDRPALLQWVAHLTQTLQPRGRGDLAAALAHAQARRPQRLVLLSDLADQHASLALTAAFEATEPHLRPQLEVVQFFSEANQPQLARLASDSGGSYRWIDFIAPPGTPNAPGRAPHALW